MEEIEDGGADINQTAKLVRRAVTEGGPMKDKRDVEGALIDKIAVALFAVIAKTFAVIGKLDGE